LAIRSRTDQLLASVFSSFEEERILCRPVLMLAAFASPFKKGREWSGWEPRHGRQSRKGSGRALRDAVEIQLR